MHTVANWHGIISTYDQMVWFREPISPNSSFPSSSLLQFIFFFPFSWINDKHIQHCTTIRSMAGNGCHYSPSTTAVYSPQVDTAVYIQNSWDSLLSPLPGLRGCQTSIDTQPSVVLSTKDLSELAKSIQANHYANSGRNLLSRCPVDWTWRINSSFLED